MAELLYFGRLTDVTGTGGEEVSLPSDVNDTSALRQWLEIERGWHGTLTDPSVRIAINDEIVPDPSKIANGDRIAFLPPVGGG
ncbi:MAG: MoaD/ThiS family protein [Pseudomonadota bacterium]